LHSVQVRVSGSTPGRLPGFLRASLPPAEDQAPGADGDDYADEQELLEDQKTTV
jgi:hypothetical protein